MSYDFLMMKPTAAIQSAEEVREEVLSLQDPKTVKEGLDRLCPQIAWERTANGGWFGSLNGEDTWYEFRIGEAPDHVWSVCTSHQAATRQLVPAICRALEVVAFDGQAGTLIIGGPD